MSKAVETTKINDLEAEIERNLRHLKRTDPASHYQKNATQENSADDLGILLRRITERSTHEVENLIDELHSLREKLESDRDSIERAIARHSELSQGTLQLTTLIADNVKGLPQLTS
jgi:predicted  nucleic acid-binding Zn-ribbon protein